MAIKPEADEIFFAKHPDQRVLANALDEAFDITFGAKHGDLSFWLAQPRSRAQERFGLQKEVLTIYCPFPQTDARILTAIEQLSRSPDFRHRLDRVMTFIIHCGDEEATRDLADSLQERVIVTFNAATLRNPARGVFYVRQAISNVIGGIDLFGMSSPLVSDRYFFGRTELVQQLTRRALAQRQNSGLFGLRKTGKTSVLYATGRAFEGQPVLFEYFDCQNPGLHNARWWDVLGNVRDRLGSALQRTHKRTTNLSKDYSPTNAGTRFVSDIAALLSDGGLEQVVVAFDEIEYITSGLSGKLGAHWDQDFLPFWQTIRAAHQELQARFSFIVAGVNPACVQRSHFGEVPNPIFQGAQPYFLEPLSRDAVRTMVRTLGRYAGMRFDDDVFEFLRMQYGGHPYLIRLACSEVWRYEKPTDVDAPRVVPVAAFLNRTDGIRQRLAQPIKDILLSLVWWYPEEYALLQILAGGDATFVREYLSENPDSLLQFAHYGLLDQSTGDFAIADVRDFLNNFGDAYKREVSPFFRSDMPPELLPEIPDLEILGRLFERRCEVEVRLRRAIVLYLGVRHSFKNADIARAIAMSLRKRPDRPKPESLFVGREVGEVMHELYMLDLKEIVVANWDVFKALFGDNKSRFEMNMDTVNQARRAEGHTRPVSKKDAEDFDNSYAWILSRLRDIEGVLGANQAS